MPKPPTLLLFQCPRCLWWIGADYHRPASTEEFQQKVFPLKCVSECGWTGEMLGKDAVVKPRDGDDLTLPAVRQIFFGSASSTKQDM
jgi:hypothetical protein